MFDFSLYLADKSAFMRADAVEDLSDRPQFINRWIALGNK